MIFIGTDHSGWKLKQELVSWLKAKKYPVKDLGAKIARQDDDYPDFAFPVASQVIKNKENLGILLCRNGIGMSMAANKVKGVRAGVCSFTGQAITARAHDNCNILVIPADFVNEEQAIRILETFLTAKFNAEERHLKRLKKITDYEEVHLR